MPAAFSVVSYVTGFIAGTSVLLAAGVALGAALNSFKMSRALYRFAGASAAGAAAAAWMVGQ